MSDTPSVVVRPAIKGDMPVVLDLIRELAVFEKEPDAVELTSADLVRDGFGDDPQFNCFVADLDGKIVGMALLYFRYSTWKGRTLHLEDLVVHERYRRKGVGTALFDQVMRYASQTGVRRVNWVVLDWNTDAIAFYKKAGATVMPQWWQVEFEKDAFEYYLRKADESI